MARTVEVTIGDTRFFVTPMDAFDALAAFGDLQKDVLPAIGDLIGAAVKDDSSPDDDAAMGRALEKLSGKLDGKQLKHWCDRLLDKDLIAVEINGADMPLDAAAKSMAFRDFTDILELLYHVIRINFAGPLAGWLSRRGLDLSQLQVAQLGAIGQK